LADLVALRRPVSEALAALAGCAGDAPEPLMEVSEAQVCGVLRRYLTGELSAGDVDEWANAIECRDDLTVESPEVREVIFELANSEISRALSRPVAEEWLRRLEQ
jgi:hypothetical protein